jgi:hypothetical protein
MNMKKAVWLLIFTAFYFLFRCSSIAGTVEKDASNSKARSAKELEVFETLKGGQKVLLCFYEPADPKFNVVKKTLDAVGHYFKGTVDIIYVSCADVSEKRFMERIMKQSGAISVFVLLPPRYIFAEFRAGDITKKNLIKALSASQK